MECRYDLRGTDAESVCPECGRAVRASIDQARRAGERQERRFGAVAVWSSVGYLVCSTCGFGVLSPLPYDLPSSLLVVTIGALGLSQLLIARVAGEDLISRRVMLVCMAIILLGVVVGGVRMLGGVSAQ